MSISREALLYAVRDFVLAPTWLKSREILERHPELLGEPAQDALQGLEDGLKEPGPKVLLDIRRRHLRRCRAVGVSQAYRECAASLFKAGTQRLEKYESASDGPTLDSAIGLFSEAAELASGVPAHADILNNLGYALRARYNGASPSEADLARAIEVLELSVEESLSDAPNRDLCLANLALSLRDRYKALNDPVDRDRAIGLLDKSLEVTPGDSPHAPERNSALGGMLADRYKDHGQLSDVERAILACQKAVELGQVGSPIDLRLAFSNDLAVTLMLRYQHLGDVSDLTRALGIAERALAEASAQPATGGPMRTEVSGEVHTEPAGLARNPVLMVTAAALLKLRYERLGTNPVDLTRAILLLDQAVPGLKEAIDEECQALAMLGVALRARYQSPAREANDLDRSIGVLEQALEAAEARAPKAVAICMANLGISLRDRYLVSRRDEDLDAAIARFEQVSRLAPLGERDEARVLKNIANVLQLRHDRSGSLRIKEEATVAYQRAVVAGIRCSLEIALGAGRDWLYWAFERRDWEAVVTAYGWTDRAERSLLERQQLRREKESWLRDTQGLASRAAYALAKLGRLEDALFTIEGGLARLWNSAHELNADVLDQLQTIRPDLARRYLEAVQRERYASTAQLVVMPLSTATKAIGFDLDHVVTSSARSEFESAVAAIREFPGYSEFLLPPSRTALESDIHAATVHAPAVYIIATEAGGMALIVKSVATPAGAGRNDKATEARGHTGSLFTVLPVELPGLSLNALRDRLSGRKDQPHFGSYLGALNDWRVRPTGELEQARWYAALNDMAGWLWDVVMGPIVDALDSAPQVTMIPTGALWLLPFQAAWRKEAWRPTGRLHALDLTVLQYTPSLRVHAASHTRARAGGNDCLLVIEEPRPVKLSPLPNAHLEAQAAASSFSPRSKIVPHQSATRVTVLEHLPQFSFVHFVCHGGADPMNPLESRLIMSNDEPLTLRDLLLLRLMPRRLAVLSACETGIIGNELPDEVMNLAAGMLEAGFAGVIATSWALNDDSTTMLMMRFYELWRQDGCELPEALRGAQQWLRDTTNAQKADYFRSFHRVQL